MEEIDKIILHTLRQIGCDIDDEVDSLQKFSTELVVEATGRCLRLVNPGADVPIKVPPSMSARFLVGGCLARACMDLGYKGDIGYQTFLYSTETDRRRVFMFLIEKLPKESEKIVNEPLGTARLIRQKICERLKQQLSVQWLPSPCRMKGVQFLQDGNWVREGFSAIQHFNGVSLYVAPAETLVKSSIGYCPPPVTEQIINRSQLLPSLISYNSTRLANADWSHMLQYSKEENEKLQESTKQEWSAMLFATKVPKTPIPLSRKISLVKDDGPPLPAARNIPLHQSNETSNKLEQIPTEAILSEEERVQQLQDEVSELTSRFENLQPHVRSLAAKAIKAGEETEAIATEHREQEEKFAVQKKTSELLPEAEVNVGKLQAFIESSSQRLVVLANQWERHRAPLIAHYRKLRETNSQRESESQRQAETLRLLRERIKELSEESLSKDRLQKQLNADFERLSKDVSRSTYTRRILEIIGNIRKQKEEIDRVRADTRQVQKEINQLTGRIDRSFAVADELIFKDAKREEAARKAYKLLATLHADCAEFVGLVEETGAIMREIRDLEDQIETESAKNVADNLERITADLKQMKQESASLMAQLKSKS